MAHPLRGLDRKDRFGESPVDVLVAGGGIAGAAAALTLAEAGKRVAIVEPSGTLGREIARGRNLFAELPKYADGSPSIEAFLRRLRARGGWFDGAIDPIAAAIAFDDLMESHGVQVWFHVWPARLSVTDGAVDGTVVAMKTGYRTIRSAGVVDATVHGKLARGAFRTRAPESPARSVLHLMFNGVAGACPAEHAVGGLRVRCRQTYWEREWRVSLIADERISRSDWLGRLPSLLPELRRAMPALAGGGLTVVGEEEWRTPEWELTTDSDDESPLGSVVGRGGRPFAIARRLVCDPRAMRGLAMAGPWLQGFPFDPAEEGTSLVQAFELGDAAGRLWFD